MSGEECHGIHNETQLSNGGPNNTLSFCRCNTFGIFFMVSFTFLICLFGFAGNAMVCWLLKFRIKSNHFTTYLLNLSISDLGVVTAIAVLDINWIVCRSHPSYYARVQPFLFVFFLTPYSSSQFLLTAISIDRCVAVFFPIWHRMHRPERLPTNICATLWIFAFLLSGVQIGLIFAEPKNKIHLRAYQYLFIALVCSLLMFVSTIALLINVYLRSWQGKQGKLLTAILLALVFFLLLAVPMDVVQYVGMYSYNSYLIEFAFQCVALNSSINPVLYFLVGRWGRRKPLQNIKATFEDILAEE